MKIKNRLSYVNEMLRVFSDMMHDDKIGGIKGKYLLARIEDNNWKIYLFDNADSAVKIRDSLFSEEERFPVTQPFYVPRADEFVSTVLGGRCRIFREVN